MRHSGSNKLTYISCSQPNQSSIPIHYSNTSPQSCRLCVHCTRHWMTLASVLQHKIHPRFFFVPKASRRHVHKSPPQQNNNPFFLPAQSRLTTKTRASSTKGKKGQQQKKTYSYAKTRLPWRFLCLFLYLCYFFFFEIQKYAIFICIHSNPARAVRPSREEAHLLHCRCCVACRKW